MDEMDKKMIIGSGNDGIPPITLRFGTNIKEAPDISESSTNTFSGGVVQGLKDVPYVVEAEQLRYDEFVDYVTLCLKVEKMMQIPDNITIIETVYPKSGNPFKTISNYFNCITTTNDDEIKPDENTVESFKFKAAKRERQWEDLVTGRVISKIEDL